MTEFNGKVVLITGATSGLGATAAITLAAKGAKVAITGRREEQGQAVLRQIDAAGGEGIFIKTDVNVRDDVERMVAMTVDRFGRLDGAVNNAGITPGPFTPVADIPDENWFATLNTNLNAVFWSMKFEIPAMLASGGGAIVNISSMYGLIGGDIGNAAYVTSKWGVIGLTKTAAIDYGQQGLRVNALCPGYCHSEMVDPYVEAEPELFKRIIDRHSAMNRLGESQEVADAIVWLLSGQSSFVNGAAIPIEGGEATRLY
ncbi:MAG: SDR family oxidoreductase [Sphingomonadales bacterium]|jgi:NAD(P)-dependent dehydrogenase (short-subunit alcohol dehydrogenase family)|nr:SDR family oxidoreductase [Sphingomonadales bacterium]MBK6491735.1 SDR family oxidoreductase [Sphingomonadales bacterium]MBK6718851.1 SDR family oxidoreductase [Sphingomonadales bacterium]MBK7283673.1 SDR family oxidoreductase [Sphingomonadales bacterium]MBK8272032.1 SDR family oxidoreductase [Sphingomonadales bacterium]